MKIKSLLLIALLSVCGLSFSQTAETYYESAMSEYNKKNYKKSIEYLNQAINLSQGNRFKLHHLYLWRGTCKFYNKDPENSVVDDLNKSIQLRNDNHLGHLYLSYTYSRAMQLEKACHHLDTAYRLGYRNDSICYYPEVSNLRTSACFNELLIKYNLIKYGFYLDIIKDIVETKINDWQRKGKFEKTIEYQVRVTEDTRNEQIQKFTRQVLDSIALSRISLSEVSNEYDADNEAFKIQFKGQEPVILKVPLDEAQNFDQNFSNLRYTRPEFTLSENIFYILHLEIFNPGNGKSYIYDSQDVVAFSSTQLNLNFDEINLSIPDENARIPVNQTSAATIVNVGKSDVDINIPVNPKVSNNRFALIIGNEDYTSYQIELNNEVNVVYARNDAKVFAEYAGKTLGIPEENIKVLYDVIGSVMKREIERVIKMAQMTNGEILFYYAGHGFPDEQNKDPYIMPVDINGSNVKDGIRLGKLYEQFSDNQIAKVTVFLDACFSGGGRSQGLLAARGVRIKPSAPELGGNLVVFAATSEDQVSMPYNDKQHGMFTYFLLKKLQETKGNLNYKELSNYLNEQVQLNSVKINYKEQSPSMMVSPKLIDTLENLKFLN
jgi:tetratricopeptide (TPR) repeat protein